MRGSIGTPRNTLNMQHGPAIAGRGAEVDRRAHATLGPLK
jgi:hypothetical protein